MAVLEADASAGERFLLSALNHFDRIHTNPGFQSLMQQEMIRLHRGEDNALSPLVEKVFRPLMEKMQQVIEEGIATGELIPVESSQIMLCGAGRQCLLLSLRTAGADDSGHGPTGTQRSGVPTQRRDSVPGAKPLYR